jgi:hypothetical protein
MRFSNLSLVAPIAIIAALAPSIASATQIATRASVVRGIPASEAAVVILERRIGSERERQLIIKYEMQMRNLNRDARRRTLELRTAIARAEVLERQSRAATAEGRSARAQLVLLRAQTMREQSELDAKVADLQKERVLYIAQVEELMNREASTRAELEAWKQAAITIGADTSQERLDLWQQYLDGERSAALDGLAELRNLRSVANANMRAERNRLELADEAKDWRRDAELEAASRKRGERTVEQELRVWEQATKLDPSNSASFIRVARLYGMLQNKESAFEAHRRAELAAVSETDQILAFDLWYELDDTFETDRMGDGLGYGQFSPMLLSLNSKFVSLNGSANSKEAYQLFLEAWWDVLDWPRWKEGALLNAIRLLEASTQRLVALQSQRNDIQSARATEIDTRRLVLRLKLQNQSYHPIESSSNFDTLRLNLIRDQFSLARQQAGSSERLFEAASDILLFRYEVGMNSQCGEMRLAIVNDMLDLVTNLLMGMQEVMPDEISRLEVLADLHREKSEISICKRDTAASVQNIKTSLEYYKKLVEIDAGNSRNVINYLDLLNEVTEMTGSESGKENLINEAIWILRRARAVGLDFEAMMRAWNNGGNEKLSALALPIAQAKVWLAHEDTNINQNSLQTRRTLIVQLIELGEIKAAQMDTQGAINAYQESLDVARSLLQMNLNSAEAQLDVGGVMLKLAEIAPTRVRWREVYQHFFAMQRNGLLGPTYEPILATTKQQAEEQDRTNPEPATPPR